jgi:hypothetical protein
MNICEVCSGKYTLPNKTRHEKTKKHQAAVQKNNEAKEAKVSCFCGGKYTPSNKVHHEKTAKHKKAVAEKAVIEETQKHEDEYKAKEAELDRDLFIDGWLSFRQDVIDQIRDPFYSDWSWDYARKFWANEFHVYCTRVKKCYQISSHLI